MKSFVGESLSCSLQGGVHAAWAGTQSFLLAWAGTHTTHQSTASKRHGRGQQTSRYAWRTDLPSCLVDRPPKPPRQCHPPLRHRRAAASARPPSCCLRLYVIDELPRQLPSSDAHMTHYVIEELLLLVRQLVRVAIRTQLPVGSQW